MEIGNIKLSKEELRRRAQEYQQTVETEEENNLEHLLIFSLENQWYACSVQHLKETMNLQEIAPLPDMHPAVAGVMNLRGALLLTCDLRKFFGMSTENPPEKMIIVETQDNLTGFLVENIKGVDTIASSRFQTGIETSAGVPPAYIKGVMMYQGCSLSWLNLPKIVKKIEEVLA